MNEYFFLYILGFIVVLFAVIQDIRTREISNWLTFSFVAFAIAYRAFYSVYSVDFMFFIYGLFGVLLFVGLGYLFYYSKVFAGGDAKLLFGLGAIFPYSSLIDYVYYGLGFILLLFIAGVFYTLIYSLFLVRRNYNSFRKSFVKEIYHKKYLFIVSLVLGILVYLSKSSEESFFILITLSVFIFLFPLLFAYVKSVEKSCMIQLVSPDKLTEGDWLERNVVVKGKIIRKRFGGLNFDEILILRRFGRKVWIKTGVPFAPAFLIALIVFFCVFKVFFFLIL